MENENDEINNEIKNNENKESKSFFGPNFRKWLHMKRALRLVHEEVYTEKIHVPRIKYKVFQLEFIYLLICLFDCLLIFIIIINYS